MTSANYVFNLSTPALFFLLYIYLVNFLSLLSNIPLRISSNSVSILKKKIITKPFLLNKEYFYSVNIDAYTGVEPESMRQRITTPPSKSHSKEIFFFFFFNTKLQNNWNKTIQRKSHLNRSLSNDCQDLDADLGTGTSQLRLGPASSLWTCLVVSCLLVTEFAVRPLLRWPWACTVDLCSLSHLSSHLLLQFCVYPWYSMEIIWIRLQPSRCYDVSSVSLWRNVGKK